MSWRRVIVEIASDLDEIRSIKSPPACTTLLHVAPARNRQDRVRSRRGEAASENRRNAGAGPGSTTLRRFFGLTRARVRADGFESLEALCDIGETPYSQQAQSLDTYGSREWD